ncbi:hypothetical protein HMPREF3206_00785 [Fusobacterium equinum]|uniref:Uncharacterized protein n=1 Tax=Fusobacterium equinum TaxID=134605 RepID=A0A133NFN8_9FUSO|nr:hypothetical protein HMPREF3206_00785 [Fusobacterium equinum]
MHTSPLFFFLVLLYYFLFLDIFVYYMKNFILCQTIILKKFF